MVMLLLVERSLMLCLCRSSIEGANIFSWDYRHSVNDFPRIPFYGCQREIYENKLVCVASQRQTFSRHGIVA